MKLLLKILGTLAIIIGVLGVLIGMGNALVGVNELHSMSVVVGGGLFMALGIALFQLNKQQ